MGSVFIYTMGRLMKNSYEKKKNQYFGSFEGIMLAKQKRCRRLR